MKCNATYILLCLVGAGMLYQAAAMDTLVLENNDLFEGQLRRVGKGVLVFRADVGGTVMVPVDEVRSLSTSEAYEVALHDGSLLVGRFSTVNGAFSLVPIDGWRRRPLRLADIASVTAIEAPADAVLASGDAEAERRWTGTARLGLRMHAGERDYAAPVLGGSLQGRTATGVFDVEGALALDDDDGFPRYYRLWSTWQPVALEPVGGLLEAEVQRETSVGLDFGGMLAISSQRRFALSPSAEAGAALGIDYVYEEHDARIAYEDRPFLRWPRQLGLVDRYAYDDSLNLRIQLRYSQQLFAGGVFDSRLVLQPSLTDWGALRGRAESRLTWPLFNDLLLRLDLLVDYHNDRPFAIIDPWQTSLEASLGWRF